MADIFVGIDPGSLKTGYAFITLVDSHYVVLCSGVLRLPVDKSLFIRAGFLFNLLGDVIGSLSRQDRYIVYVEEAFLGKNPRALAALSMMRGVVAAAFYGYNVDFHDVLPSVVKRAICGCGASDKDSVRNVISRVFPSVKVLTSDHSDALAIALCASLTKL